LRTLIVKTVGCDLAATVPPTARHVAIPDRPRRPQSGLQPKQALPVRDWPRQRLQEKETNPMRASDFNSSKYLSASEFGDQPSNWTITAVGSEIIGRDDPQKKPVLRISDSNCRPAGRGLVLNVTNLRALARGFGDDMEAWVGRPIRINSIWVSYQGEQVRGTRVTPGVTAMRAAGDASRDIKDDLDDEIPLSARRASKGREKPVT
jgi:hypothetical protein